MIELRDFEKYYGKFQAVKPTSFKVNKGEVFGLLGPNGSGKSTIIRGLVGLLKPTGGQIFIDGHNVQKDPLAAKRLISYIPQRITMPDNLTGREVVQFYAGLRNLPVEKVNEVLEFARLNGHSEKLIREYSGGLLQRLGLSIAFLEGAPILIMDEPTLNLDPRGMKQFRRFVRKRKNEGITILFASHILADAESFADRVGIMVEGELVRIESVSTLYQEIQDRSTVVLRVSEQDENHLKAALAAGARKAWFENGYLRFTAPVDKRLSILQALEKTGTRIDRFATEDINLDTLLMEHFGDE